MDVCADALVGDKRDGGAGDFERVKCGRGGKNLMHRVAKGRSG